jgi:hypothetical protein
LISILTWVGVLLASVEFGTEKAGVDCASEKGVEGAAEK